MEIKILHIGTQRLRVALWPGKHSSTPLLICNGIGANLELVKPFVDALEGVNTTIAFDAPGVGGSSVPLLPYRFSGLARLISRMLDQLGYEQVDVLGVSWGGGLAQQFAYNHPRRCRRLILAATSPGVFMVPGMPCVLLKLADPRRYYRPSHMIDIASKIYGGVFRNDPSYAHNHVRMIKPPAGIGYCWQLLAVTGWTSIHWLHRLHQPTLIMAGTDDPIIPLINARIMARCIPKSSLAIMDCGHLFLLTRPALTALIVRQFLDENLRPV